MHKIMTLRKVGETFVVTIPIEMLKKLKWKVGDKIDVRLDGTSIVARLDRNGA